MSADAPPVWWRRPWTRVVGVLALLAYVPALTARPGRMPADSKLYLYLDPGRFLADATGTFDPRQFAGWVPHQHVSYLWPAGPWYRWWDLLGLPDWIAHRLWIGTIMLAAGAGVYRFSRDLGVGVWAACTAAVVYQVSPYVLPYVSRTSVMLLPWAGLGWIAALALRAARRGGWLDPLLLGLVVFTVGAVNATALAMIVPAPVLVLAHEAFARRVTWRDSAFAAVRVAAVCALVSLWWIVALVLQGRHGADVLAYSESLADVSSTSTSAEVWRSLGYWLFYVRDPFAPTTTESSRYLLSTPTIFLSYLVPIVCLLGLVWTRWAHRRLAAALVACGVVLAVGVHPIGDRSPLMRLLTGDGEGGLALALRSSTRALPLMTLGLALGAAALVDGWRDVRWRGRHVQRPAALAVMAIALAAMPGLWTGAWVDPAIDRDQDPPEAWLDASATLDAHGSDGRVLMLPGAEFGAFRWGYTVDPPLPGLTDRPVVTRDLLPLGSPGAMDLLLALDDRFQTGTAEPAMIGPVARLLGADTVWLANDQAFDRFRTPRPVSVRDVVLASDAVGDVSAFGDPVPSSPELPMTDGAALADPRVGEPLAPVELAMLADGPTRVRAAAAMIAVAGSGDGIVDAAAAGYLPDGVTVRYVADDPAWSDDVVGVVITDSNRDRARHWRSSQDTVGFTESGGSGNDLLVDEVAADARLPLFLADGTGVQTVAEQRGPVRATASAYGEPFAYLPEHRAVMAIDGDPRTAWVVGEHGDAVGERILLEVPGGSGDVAVLREAVADRGRRIAEIEVVDGAGGLDATTRRRVRLVAEPGDFAPSGSGFDLLITHEIPLTPGSTHVEITITAVAGGVPGTTGAFAGVGFAEIDLGAGPTTEYVRPPAGVLNRPIGTPVAYVFTRDRVDPLDRWRSDPEPVLRRVVDTEEPMDAALRVDVRIDGRATDAELAELFGWPVVATERLTGSLRSAGAAAFDGDPATSWITDWGRPDHARLTVLAPEPVSEMTVSQPMTGVSTITELAVRSGPDQRRLPLLPDALGSATLTFDPPLEPGVLEIAVGGADIATTVDRRYGDIVELPVAIGEISFPGAPTVDLNAPARWDCVDIAMLDGRPIRATITSRDGDWHRGEALRAEPCGDGPRLEPGEHVLDELDDVFQLDRIVLDHGLDVALSDLPAAPVVDTVDRGRYDGRFVVSGCETGCWFTFGEGFSTGWSAELDGTDLGPPHRVDGGFTAWWLPPGDDARDVTVRWTLQTPLTVALVVSFLGALGALVATVWLRRPTGPFEPAGEPPVTTAPGRLDRPAVVAGGLVWIGTGFLLIGPSGALWGLIAAAGLWRCRRSDLTALVALCTVAAVGAVVVAGERRWAPLPNGAWPLRFERVHDLGMFAAASLVALIATEVAGGHGHERSPDPSPSDEPASLPSEA